MRRECLSITLPCFNTIAFNAFPGGGPRVVVSTAVFHARVRGSVPGLSGLKKTKNVSSPSLCESPYCGEPPWPRGSMLGLRPPGLEFRILCLEDSVIPIISPFSGGSPGPVYSICAQRWPKARFISFLTHSHCHLLLPCSLLTPLHRPLMSLCHLILHCRYLMPLRCLIRPSCRLSFHHEHV